MTGVQYPVDRSMYIEYIKYIPHGSNMRLIKDEILCIRLTSTEYSVLRIRTVYAVPDQTSQDPGIHRLHSEPTIRSPCADPTGWMQILHGTRVVRFGEHDRVMRSLIHAREQVRTTVWIILRATFP